MHRSDNAGVTSRSQSQINKQPEFLETHARLQKAEKLRQAGQIDQAIVICQQLVRSHPDYMGALHTLGMLAIDKKDYARALGFLVRASMLNPLNWQTLVALSNVYLKLDAPEMAAQTLESARALNPDDSSIYSTLGEIYYKQNEYELAIKNLEKSVIIDSNSWQVQMRLGQCLSHIGEYRKAAKYFKFVARKNPNLSDPLLWLTSLPTPFIDANAMNWIKRAAASENAGNPWFDSSLLFARGSLHDKLGDKAAAWKDFVEGNLMMKKVLGDDSKSAFAVMDFTLDRIKNRQPKPLHFKSNRERDCISLFILGPSRSGKTTVETLVCNLLEDVRIGYENPIAQNAIRHTFQSAGFLDSQAWSLLPKECEEKCREYYLNDLAIRARGAKVFTNTHPGIIAHVDRIVEIIPNCRFVFMKRDFHDVVFRIFSKKFAEGFSYSYDLKDVKKYVTWYYEMSDVLSSILKERSIVLNYEDIVLDPKSAVLEISKLCDQELKNDVEIKTGDDRGCSQPYLREILREIEN